MFREAYLESAEYFAGVVDRIDVEGWEAPALGEWTVRDLAGHTYRSLTTILSYSSPPAETVDVESAADFIVKATTGPNAGPGRTAELGRAAGLEIIDSPQMMVRGFFNFVREKLTELDDDTIMKSPLGGIRLSEYLQVRTMELVVHTMDLAEAGGPRRETARRRDEGNVGRSLGRGRQARTRSVPGLGRHWAGPAARRVYVAGVGLKCAGAYRPSSPLNRRVL